MTKAAKYSAEDIVVLKGLEAVRKRPGMYIGGVDSGGLHHLVESVLDEAMADARSGGCTRIAVTLHADGSCSIADNGRPFAPEAIEPLMTTLHSGCRCARGDCGHPHGLNYPMVSALSSRLELDLWQGGEQHRQLIERGGLSGGLLRVEVAEPQPTPGGMRLRFWPDRTIFEASARFSPKVIDHRLRDLAALHPGLETRLNNEAHGDVSVHCFPDGLVGLVRELARGPGVPAEPLSASAERDGSRLRCALLWRPGELSGTHLFSWANAAPTRMGGAHVVAFNQALSQAFSALSPQRRITAERASTSLVAAIAVDVPCDALQFQGATREALATPGLSSKLGPGLLDSLLTALRRDRATTDVLLEHMLKPGRR